MSELWIWIESCLKSQFALSQWRYLLMEERNLHNHFKHPACKSAGVGMLVVMMIWLELFVSCSSVPLSPPITLSSNKIQNGDILVLAYPGWTGKWPLNERRHRRHRNHFKLCWIVNVVWWLAAIGMAVLTVIATDPDNGNNGSVTYFLKQCPMKGGQPLFAIDNHIITTRQTNALDRETQSEYTIIVQAKDRGSPPMMCTYSQHFFQHDWTPLYSV